MKILKTNHLFIILLAFLGLGMSSCIDSDETEDAILVEDKRAIEQYLEDNPISSVKELNDEVTGIRILWQEVSNSGKLPTNLDTATVDYTGRLLSDRVFDTSIEAVAVENNIFSDLRNYIPIKFTVGRGMLIVGFEYAIEQMEEGDKATVIMPSLFGYGNSGSGDIPPNSPLIFELNLIEVKDGPGQ